MKYTKIMIRSLLLVVLTASTILACKQEPIGQLPTDGTPPGTIKNVVIEPQAGGAKISYKLPDENDISYVLCEYTTEGGDKKVARSSVYQNFLTIEGFGEIKPVSFSLYLVDHSENRSSAYSGSFTPLEPNFSLVFKSINVVPDFGGVLFNWKNISKELLGFFLYAKDDQGNWQDKGLFFSSKDIDRRSLRGFGDQEREFGIQVMDRFGFKSDTMVISSKPLYEKMLDKKKFSDGYLAGDNNTNRGGRPLSNIWDGNVDVIWHTEPTAGFLMPETFTIDLGTDAQLSRMVLWNRLDYSYAQHNPRLLEVWGSNILSHPRTDNYWKTEDWKKEWVLLGDFEEVKPSGLPYGKTTNEDKAAEQAGFEFIYEPGKGKMRYLRFVVKETWQKTSAIHFGELSIYGDDGTR
ncbi:DUF5000 domain-containing lipoprotein [Sphingobacterium multivorum]|uniref:DUF5000 domain-containing lipoprotein n=1 Tax=Sphingobacterium multivorum TaxID=28454 RepID=UPI0028ACADA3|nr:DUF5000 domain-containing lipoprotein [Sphingobacterium multivorum]